RRPAGPATDQVRAGHQHQDRQDARPRRALVPPTTRRRGDRIEINFVAVHESAIGTSRTSEDVCRSAAVEGIADITILDLSCSDSSPASRIRSSYGYRDQKFIEPPRECLEREKRQVDLNVCCPDRDASPRRRSLCRQF